MSQPLTPGAARLLRAIRAFPGLPITRYAWVLGTDYGNTKRRVQALANAGLITRTLDGNRRHLYPSEAA